MLFAAQNSQHSALTELISIQEILAEVASAKSKIPGQSGARRSDFQFQSQLSRSRPMRVMDLISGHKPNFCLEIDSFNNYRLNPPTLPTNAHLTPFAES